MINIEMQARHLDYSWSTDKRWQGVQRNYSSIDVVRLRPTITVKHTLADVGAGKLWKNLNAEGYLNTFGAMTGGRPLPCPSNQQCACQSRSNCESIRK